MNPYEPPRLAQPLIAAAVVDGSETVVAQFTFTPDFVIQIWERQRSLHALNKIFRVLKYLAAILFIATATYSFNAGRTFGGILLACLGAYLLFSNQINIWRMRQKLLASPYINEVFRVEFSDAGMRAVSPSQESKLKWNLFTRMVQFDEGFLLMQGPHQWNWIPCESILGESGRERLSNLLTANIADSEDRRTRRSS